VQTFAEDEKLQVILLKLWDLGKYVKYNKEVR